MGSPGHDDALRATVDFVRAYKFLEPDGSSIFANFRWPQPSGGRPGPWVQSDVRPCHSGVHACGLPELAYWMRATMWEIELDGEIVESRRKVVAPRGRLVRCIDDYPVAARELCAVSAWRTRDRAVQALIATDGHRFFRRRRHRGKALADRFAACDTLAAVEALGTVIDEQLTEPSHASTAAHMAVDAAHFAPEGHPREHSAFIACNAAGFAGDDFDTGFAAERRFQSGWLAERLGLTA
jgi:hypothetical protein